MSEQGQELAARFAAVVHQRSPIAAIVSADSELRSPSDLPGSRVSEGRGLDWLAREYRAATSRVGPSEMVPMSYSEAPDALSRGEVDVIVTFAELLPRIERRAGIPLRAIDLHIEGYASGLVAGDHVPDELVRRMAAAVSAALEQQRRDPKQGVDELVRRYPEVDPAEALQSWTLLEPYVFTGVVPGSMTREGWEKTIGRAAAAHSLPLVRAETVYRYA